MIKTLTRAIKRQLTNKFAYIIIALLISMITPFITQMVASAATPYDPVIKTTDQLELTNANCESINANANFGSLITNIDAWGSYNTNDFELIKQKWLDTLADENGSWVVYQQNIANEGKRIVISFSQSPTAQANFYQSGVETNLQYIAPDGVEISFYLDNNCGINVAQLQHGYTMYSHISQHCVGATYCNEEYNNFYEIFLANVTIDYPNGYIGDIPPQTAPDYKETVFPTISATVTDKTVIFKLDELPFKPCTVNYMISYSEKPNNDYGESILETLKLGWQQIFSGDITLEEWRKGGQTYDSEVIDFKFQANPENEVIVESPDLGSIMIYAVVGTEWHAPLQSCGDNGQPDDFEYDVQPRLQFINIDGSNYAIDGTLCDTYSNVCDTTTAKSDLMDCFTDSFPFININECKKAVAVVGERLSFNRVSFGNSWIHAPQCKQLGTLGDWIGASNKTVCPYFSSHVRSIIDPFVTFILGLLVMSFIARNTGKDF